MHTWEIPHESSGQSTDAWLSRARLETTRTDAKTFPTYVYVPYESRDAEGILVDNLNYPPIRKVLDLALLMKSPILEQMAI